jgi:hypothetical protein
MALLTNFYSKFEGQPDGTKIGIHRVTLLSSSDTVNVPKLANATSAASVKGLAMTGQTLPTIANSNAYTVTIASGAAGDVVWFVTIHQGQANYGPTV